VAALIWLASAAVLGKSNDNQPFSSDELAKLRAGKLVKRASSEHRGTLQLMGGSSWQLIDAPPDAVYRALLDTTQYSRMLPAVTGSRLVTEQQGARVIRLEHKRGPISLSYDVRATFDPGRRDLNFRLEDAPGGAPRAAWGFFSVRAYGPKYSLLAYGVMADPGDGLLVGLLRGSVHDWMLMVPNQVKSFIESEEGRRRYPR